MATVARVPQIESEYISSIIEKVDVDRIGIHASQVDGTCLLKSYYRESISPRVPVDPHSALRFARGLGIESYMVINGAIPVIKEGIYLTLDDICTWGIVELKSTAKSLRNFDPLTTYPWWTMRIKLYCYATETDTINLVVFFTRGNYKDIMEALRAYRIQFTPHELKRAWQLAQARKNLLKKHLGSKTPIPPKHVNPLRFTKSKLECESCEVSDFCYWYHEYRLVRS